MLLNDRSIVITGAAQGIGKATALACGGFGASVVLGDVNGELVQDVAREIEERGGRAVALDADASRRDDARRLVQASLVVREGRRVGLRRARRVYQPAADFEDEGWDTVIGQGLTGYFRLAQQAAAPMLGQGSGSRVHHVDGRTAGGPTAGPPTSPSSHRRGEDRWNGHGSRGGGR